MTYTLYTDGATSNNIKGEGIGGYAWIILNENKEKLREERKKVVGTTNNECELMGIISGCQNIIHSLSTIDKVEVISDSAYCIRCYKDKWWENWLRNGWLNSKKQPVANKELWELLIPFFKDSRFTFKNCKGHAGNYWNEYVDKLAVQARLQKI